MRRLAPWVLVPALAAALAAAGAAEDGYRLVLCPVPGQVYLQRENLQFTMDFQYGDTAAEAFLEGASIEFKMGVLSRIDVREVQPDGNIGLGQTFIAIMSDAGTPGLPVSERLDTTDPMLMPSMENLLLAGVVGDGYDVNVDARGKVTGVTGVDDMIARMAARLGLSEEDAAALQEEALLTDIGFTDVSCFPSDYAAGVYPDEPVGVGDSWQSNTSSCISGVVSTMENTYTLTSLEGGKALISVEADIESKDVGAIMVGEFYEPDTLVAGRQKGTIVINQSTGWVEKIDLQLDLAFFDQAPGEGEGDVFTGGIVLHADYSFTSEPK